MTIRLHARAMIAMREAIAGGGRASASTMIIKTMAARGAAAIKTLVGDLSAKSYFGAFSYLRRLSHIK